MIRRPAIVLALALSLTAIACEPLHSNGVLRLDVHEPDPEVRRLTESGARLPSTTVSSAPAERYPDQPALEPTAKATLNGVTYVIDEDEVLLLNRLGTKIWRSPGILGRLTRSSRHTGSAP